MRTLLVYFDYSQQNVRPINCSLATPDLRVLDFFYVVFSFKVIESL